MWRYLSLSAVIATIKTQQLRLTRVDKFRDPFEGSIPKAQFEQQVPLFIAAASRRAMFAANQGMAGRPMQPDEDQQLGSGRLFFVLQKCAERVSHIDTAEQNPRFSDLNSIIRSLQSIEDITTSRALAIRCHAAIRG